MKHLADSMAKMLANDQIRAYALALGGTARRCVEQGYDPRGHVLAAIAAQLPQPARVVQAGSAAYAALELQPRPSPSEHAMDVEADVLDALVELRMPSCMVAQALPISRARLDGAWRTVVPVALVSPATTHAYVLVDAEPLTPPP